MPTTICFGSASRDYTFATAYFLHALLKKVLGLGLGFTFRI